MAAAEASGSSMAAWALEGGARSSAERASVAGQLVAAQAGAPTGASVAAAPAPMPALLRSAAPVAAGPGTASVAARAAAPASGTTPGLSVKVGKAMDALMRTQAQLVQVVSPLILSDTPY